MVFEARTNLKLYSQRVGLCLALRGESQMFGVTQTFLTYVHALRFYSLLLGPTDEVVHCGFKTLTLS